MTEKSPLPLPVPTVRHVEMHRYMGKWFVIAAVPNSLEKGKVATSDTYRELGDGTIEVVYTFRKGSLDAPEKTWEGTARVVDTGSKATWKVRFFWLLTAEYRIIHLEPGYRWSVVTDGSGKLLWVLARERQLPEREYREILRRVQKDGFDITKLRKVPQPAG
jgi:apolipoprotein D and lipocalin family protein